MWQTCGEYGMSYVEFDSRGNYLGKGYVNKFHSEVISKSTAFKKYNQCLYGIMWT